MADDSWSERTKMLGLCCNCVFFTWIYSVTLNAFDEHENRSEINHKVLKKKMARNVIMGYYYCNLNHSHSSDAEVIQCNKMEEEEKKREHHLQKEGLEHKKQEQENEAKRIQLEQERLEHDKKREQMRHEEKLAQIEAEKMKLENQRCWSTKPGKSKLCVVL